MFIWDVLLYVTGAVILLILILFVIGFVFYELSIKRNQRRAMDEEDLNEIIEHIEKSQQWLREQDYQEYTIDSHDHLKLSAKYLDAPKKTNKFVILVHGYMSESSDMGGFAWLFQEKYNFNVLLPDLRGHGKSEGHYVGFGYHDRLDVLSWINFIIDEFGEDCEIVLLGISMGGATVSYLSGEQLPKQVKFIISDCAYDSIKGILSYQLRRRYRLPAFPLLNITSFITKLRAGYSFMQEELVEYIKKAKIPMLFIHGGKDDFVPTKMAYTLYNSCKAEKKLLIVEGATHGAAHSTDSERYEKVVEEFINKYISLK